MKTYYTYITTNTHRTVLYIGMTNSLERRMFEHKGQFKKSFTQRYNCNRLVYYEEFQTPLEAIRREKYLKKKLTRAMKEEMITRFNPGWKDLSEKWFDAEEFIMYRRLDG
jgi:putative endonuclease